MNVLIQQQRILSAFHLNSSQLEILKILAIVLMVGDHIASIVFDQTHILKMIGRIVFPLFGFLLVYNYLYNTSSQKKYIFRLFIFALISQPFYWYSLDNGFLNIFFTLSLSLGLIYLIDYYNKHKARNNLDKALIVFLLSIPTIVISIFLSYSIWGIILIISFYLLLVYRNVLFLGFVFFILLFLNPEYLSIYTLFAISSLLLIYSVSLLKIKVPRINKWFFYAFYPLHLIFIKFSTLL